MVAQKKKSGCFGKSKHKRKRKKKVQSNFVLTVLAWIIGCLVVLNYLHQWQEEFPYRKLIRNPIAKSLDELPRIGKVIAVNQNEGEKSELNYNAQSINKSYHPSNSFLIRFNPFNTKKLWVPMYAVSSRLKYLRDEYLFKGRSEVWQTSKQAYRHMRGDCEDHAILLADWLIELGYDARVVIGEMDNGGHAWVVLFHDDKVYLLEATSKLSRRSFPLARYKTNYQPRYMFNQNYFWKNEGSAMITDYTSKNWKKVSRFIDL